MNSSLRYALEKIAFALASLMIVAGCGSEDGSSELAAGKAAYEVRDFTKAAKFFEKSVSRSPENVDALLYLARVRLDLGELSEARKLADKAWSLDSASPDITLLRAQLAWHAKDYATAAKAYAEIGANGGLDAEIRAQALAGLGVVEMTCNNHHLARVAFLKAIRLDRRCAAAWYHLGIVYRDFFDYPEAALEQFEIFVRLEASASPRVQKVQRNVIPPLKEAVANRKVEQPGAAKRNSAECASSLATADAAWAKGNFKGARQAYQAALAADALSYPAALGLAKSIAKTDSTKDGQKKAYESYRLACKLKAGAISTFLTTGAMADQLGLYAQAVEIYSRALAADPTSIPAADGLFRALRKAGNKQQVAAAYQSYRDLLSAGRKAKSKKK